MKLNQVKITHYLWAHKAHSEETLIKMSEAQGTAIYVYSLGPDKSTLINSFSSANKAAKHFNCDKNTILRNAKNGKIFKGEYILSINPK